MHYSHGIIQYDEKGHWVKVLVDQDLVDYYYSLIPKYHRVILPRWMAHVSVVRPEDGVTDLSNWGKHHGEIARFVYDPTILYEKGFWWFNLWSVEMENIRRELDLSCKSRITIPPPGYVKCFHCTIGKDVEIA